MVIIDTNRFKPCKDCGDWVIPNVRKLRVKIGGFWGGKCKECRSYDFLIKRLKSVGHDWLRDVARKHFNTGLYASIVGCSQQEFKNHLEDQFKPWMSWDNKATYGVKILPKNTWDLDHKKPWITATTDKEKRKLCHYSNIQPMCSYKNRYIKRGK